MIKFAFHSLPVFLLACLLMAGCAQKAEPPKPQPPVVTVAAAQQRDVQLYDQCTGKTVAYQSVNIVPRVKGYLEQIHYTPGEIVQPGQLLFQIQDFDYKINQSKAYAAFYEAKTAADLAKSLYDTAIRTNKLTPNTVTADEMSQKRARYLNTSTQVYAAQAEYQYQTQQLFYTRVTSPIRGKVEKNLIDVGDFVGSVPASEVLTTVVEMDPMYVDFEVPDSFFSRQYAELVKKTGGPKIAPVTPAASHSANKPEAEETLAAPAIPAASEEYNEHEALVIDATPEIPEPLEKLDTKVHGTTGTGIAGERQPNGKNISVPFEIGFQEDPDKFPIRGELIYADNRINPKTGTIRLRGEFRNPQYLVYPGRTCNVRMPGELVKGAIVIDERAVNADLSAKYVWVVDSNKVAWKRYIVSQHLLPNGRERIIAPYAQEKVTNLDGTPATVETGLRPGEKYIVEGFQKVRAGLPVSQKSVDKSADKPAEQGGGEKK